MSYTGMVPSSVMALPALLNIALLLLLVMFIFSVFGMTMFKQVSYHATKCTQYGLYRPGYTGKISKLREFVVFVCVFKVGQFQS